MFDIKWLNDNSLSRCSKQTIVSPSHMKMDNMLSLPVHVQKWNEPCDMDDVILHWRWHLEPKFPLLLHVWDWYKQLNIWEPFISCFRLRIHELICLNTDWKKISGLTVEMGWIFQKEQNNKIPLLEKSQAIVPVCMTTHLWVQLSIVTFLQTLTGIK